MDKQYLELLKEAFWNKPKPKEKENESFPIKIKGIPVKLVMFQHLKTNKTCNKNYKEIERNLNSVYDKVLKYGCDEFYKTYKDWQDPPPKKVLSYNEFKRKIRPKLVIVYPDCELSVMFNDAGLVGHHDLYVNLNNRYIPTGTQFEG